MRRISHPELHGQTLAKLTERCIPLGELVGTHGLAGWLKLKPFAPDSVALSSAREIALADGQKSDWYQVSEAKRHKRIFLIKLESIDDVSRAEHLVGREVWVREDSLEPLREREYFHHEVIGFDVFDLQSNYLGKITRMWFKAGGDLYVVSTAKNEHLIPATKEMIEGVDLRNRRIIVDLPEGLLEL